VKCLCRADKGRDQPGFVGSIGTVKAQIPVNNASGSRVVTLVQVQRFLPRPRERPAKRFKLLEKMMSRWTPHLRCRLAARLSVLAMAALTAGTAWGHVFPKEQEPAAGTAVASPPYVRITFDGPLEPSFSSLQVTDAAGKQVNVEKAKVDPSHHAIMSVALPTLAAAHYVVHWVAVASDGHRTHGDYPFDVK
jgi:copper resistance protein C